MPFTQSFCTGGDTSGDVLNAGISSRTFSNPVVKSEMSEHRSNLKRKSLSSNIALDGDSENDSFDPRKRRSYNQPKLLYSNEEIAVLENGMQEVVEGSATRAQMVQRISKQLNRTTAAIHTRLGVMLRNRSSEYQNQNQNTHVLLQNSSSNLESAINPDNLDFRHSDQNAQEKDHAHGNGNLDKNGNRDGYESCELISENSM